MINVSAISRNAEQLQPAKLDWIQALRGLAALLVVLHHSASQVASAEPVQLGHKAFFVDRYLNPDFGAIGVDLFFVLSGFIMVFTTSRTRMTTLSFLKRRVMRIYPLYWIYCILAVLLHSTRYFGPIEGDVVTKIKSVGLYPVFWHNMELLRPAFVPQGWTLNFEMLFYVIFSLTLRLRPMVQLVVTALFMAAMCAVAQQFNGLRSAEIQLLSDPIVMEFPLGMLIGRLYCDKGAFLRPALSLGVGFIAILLVPLFWSSPTSRLFHLGIPAFLFVSALQLGTHTGGCRVPKGLLLLGDASYSIYLSHTVVLEVFQAAFVRLPVLRSVPCDFYYGTLVLVALAVGVASYRWIEQPILALARRSREAT